MSVKTIFWENRLTKAIRKPGGVTLDEALDRAQSNLGSVKDQCLAALDEKLPQFKSFLATPAPEDRAARLKALYDLCSDVLNVANPAGFEPIGKAAYSLCDLTDRMQARPSDEWAPVVVHVETIGLLRGALAGDEAGSQALLGGLRKVVERELAKAAPPAPSDQPA